MFGGTLVYRYRDFRFEVRTDPVFLLERPSLCGLLSFLGGEGGKRMNKGGEDHVTL